jgi:hypothetical protein
MFHTERQRQLSHFVAELKCIIAEKCLPEITDEEIEYVYSALAASLINEVSRWTFEDLNKKENAEEEE